MPKPPPKLYRAVNGKALENYHIGNLWFRSHAWFRKQKDGDGLEGVGSYNVPGQGHSRNVSDDHPVKPAYFMSFSETSEGALTHGRDKHYLLEFSAPAQFRDWVRRNLPECGADTFVKVDWIRIEYGKTMDVDSDPGPSEGWNRQFHCKPEEFADEREWRLQIRFLHSFRIQKFRRGGEIQDMFALLK